MKPLLLLLTAASLAFSQGAPILQSFVHYSQVVNGVDTPLAGAYLCSFQAGTTTPQTTWADALESSPNTNPIVLDVNGNAQVFINPALSYKYVLYNGGTNACPSTGAVIFTQDGVQYPTSGGGGGSITCGSGCTITSGVLSINIASTTDILVGDGHGDAIDSGIPGTGSIASAYISLGNNSDNNSGGGTEIVTIGDSAGVGQTGTNVIAIGYHAAYNSNQNEVLAIGDSAALSNQGTLVVALGDFALDGNGAAGDGAIGVGWEAGNGNTAEYLAAVGAQAGRLNTGAYAVDVGYQAGYSNTGNQVINLGYLTGTNNPGNYQIAIGPKADIGHTGGDSDIFIGNGGTTRLTGSQKSIALSILIGDSSTTVVDNNGGSSLTNIVAINGTATASDETVIGNPSTTTVILGGITPAVSGTRYVCISTTGALSSSASACSGS